MEVVQNDGTSADLLATLWIDLENSFFNQKVEFSFGWQAFFVDVLTECLLTRGQENLILY